MQYTHQSIPGAPKPTQFGWAIHLKVSGTQKGGLGKTEGIPRQGPGVSSMWGARRMGECPSILCLAKHAINMGACSFRLFCFSRQSSTKHQNIANSNRNFKTSLFSKTRWFPSPNINWVSSYIPPNSMFKLVLMKTGSVFLAKECCLLSLCPSAHTVSSGLIRP